MDTPTDPNAPQDPVQAVEQPQEPVADPAMTEQPVTPEPTVEAQPVVEPQVEQPQLASDPTQAFNDGYEALVAQTGKKFGVQLFHPVNADGTFDLEKLAYNLVPVDVN